MLLVAQKPDHAPVCPVCPALKPEFKNPYQPNRVSKQVISVNSRNQSSLKAFFIYDVSGEVMAKFCQKPDLYRKVQSA
jgi:hypothetical protein